MDPININNYNKFLKDIDKKYNNKKYNTKTTSDSQINFDDFDLSYFLDSVMYNYYFLNNNLIYNDNNLEYNYDYNNVFDENLYRDKDNDKDNNENVDKKVKPKKKFQNIKLKDKNREKDCSKKINRLIINDTQNLQNNNNINSNSVIDNKELKNININFDINSIDDLLKIINENEYDPKYKYNIDLESLHKIKEPLVDLNNMIGMKELKHNIIDQVLYYIQSLHKCSNKNNSEFMHTVIYGPPGTGKTEVAKIMGSIYSKIGVLKKNVFKKATRSDLVAGYLGQTAIKTREVITSCLGGVLFIDEAYALGNNEKRDSFSKECIDTLCEALTDHKDELMVIIAGYQSELKDCFFNYNQGLESRFNWRFKMDNYTEEDLYKIFLKKVHDINWEISDDKESLKKISIEWFKKNMVYFKFYGRDVETFLTKIKICHSRRVFGKNDEEKKKINYVDFENGFKVFLQNDDIKNRKDEEDIKSRMSSLYI